MIPIVFSTDHRYVMPCGVAISSLLMSDPGQAYDVYVLAGADVDAADREMLQRQVAELSPESRISFVDVGHHYADGYEIRGISKACYYRLMIPWLLPQLDKVVYADVDVIFKASVRPIFETDLDGKYLAASFTISEDTRGRLKRYFDRIGADWEHYFNSGILVINSAKMREDSLNKEFQRLSGEKFLYQDQDILNIVCRGKTAFFDQRYNLRPNTYAAGDFGPENVIIHYVGDKPWHTFTYAWAQWWEACERTIFFDGDLYREISRQVLSTRHSIKKSLRHTKIKLQILSRLVGK